MAVFLLLAFIATPIVEIAIFIEVGGAIGLWPTLAIVVATAVAGSWLLRRQGLATLRRAQQSLANHEFPLREVADGMCLLFAGALLLTPGFVTDAFGLALFVPGVRRAVQALVVRWLAASGRAHIIVDGEDVSARRDSTIEGDYKEIPSDDDRLPPGRGR